tara:strand:- start:273 stop:977 length:705 start_codon:yes stop_codon:yes gene_type:complete
VNVSTKNLLFILPFICFVLGYSICNILIGNKTYTTPNLIGITTYEALKLTSPHQINIRIVAEKESNHIPAGTILNQKPSAGRLVKTHQPILVTTTKSPPIITAPQLTTQKQNYIETTCKDMHLKCKLYHIEYQAPAQSCIGQLPYAGDTVEDNKMTCYIAQNKVNMYIMPDLTQHSLPEVLNFLNQHSERVSIFYGSKKIKEPYTGFTKVISQKPLAGSIIKLDSKLHIYLEVA